MPLDFNELRAERDARAQARTRRPALTSGSFQDEQESPDLSLLDRAGDALMGIPRGIEGAAQDVYGLADAVAFDALPNWEERMFGESKTWIGGAIEGITNFSAGFVPVFGWVGKAGRVGEFLTKAPALRAAVAGAITDFAVFNGHEARLSNLLQSVPALQNPVSEFLAAKKEDPELLGRFKNAVEGLGVGALTDGLVSSLRGLKAGRAVRAAGGSEREVSEAVQKAATKDIPPSLMQLPSGVAPSSWSVGDRVAFGNGVSGTISEVLSKHLRVAREDGTSVLVSFSNEIPVTHTKPELAPPTVGDGLPSSLAEPSTLEQAAPVTLATPEPVKAAPEEILRSFDIGHDDAEKLFAHARSREALDLDPFVNPRKLSEQERFFQGMQKSDLNLSHYRGAEGGAQFMRAMEQLIEPLKGHGAATAKTMNEQETEALAQLADIVSGGGDVQSSMQQIVAAAQRDHLDLPSINRRVIAYKGALDTFSGYVSKKASALQFPGQATDLARLEFAESLDTMAQLELHTKGLLGEQGRGLGANRRPTIAVSDLLKRDEIDELLRSKGGRARIDDLAAKYRMVYEGQGGTAGAMDLARAGRGKRIWAAANEYWYNALLGRPTTIAVNGMANLLTAAYLPLEKMLGGAATLNSAAIGEGIGELVGLAHSFKESLLAAHASIKAGGNLLDPMRAVSDILDPARRAITASAAGLEDSSVSGRAVNWLGKLVRLPSTALQATDEFAKSINYRSIARVQLTKDALGKGLVGEDAARYVVEGLDKLIYQGQAYGSAQLYHRGVEDAVQAGKKSRWGIDEHAREFVAKATATGEHQRLSQIAGLAQGRAEEATFSKPLTPGTLPYRVQSAVLAHPALRLVMPFVRTPVNIAMFAFQRLDVPGVIGALGAKKFPGIAATLEGTRNRFIQDMLSNDASRVASATGRLTAGMSLTSFVLMKAAETDEAGLPAITGRGPSDRARRQLLEDAGWQPYSIRIGDKYISYARLDPFASMIGTAADVIDNVRHADEYDQNEAEQLSWGLAVGLASNFTNKTYLAGLANFMDALSDPERKIPTLFRTLGASFVPGEFAAAVSVSDPYMRDVQSMNDALKARLPGSSETLPPLRNMLGEPVTRAKSLGSDASSITNAFVPLLYREVSHDAIAAELRQLGHGFTPPRREKDGVDLSSFKSASGQTAYDRWLELHGQVQLGGRTLREALSRLIRSKAYERIPPESTHDLETPRVQLIQNVLDDYRHAAYRQMSKEFPEVRELDRQHVTLRRALMAGQEKRPQVLQQLGVGGGR